MDFGSLLYAAQKNEQKQKETPNKFYKTKFDPPKKEERKQKTLSAGIQKFLARKEEEERRKTEEARKKREELLALRSQDKKSFKRVQSMLKRTKSANKAVIEDAVDDVNTAVTAAGPIQCDEDDYGYVSQEAAAYYNKLMDKYAQMPANEPKFSKKVLSDTKDLSSTKDRVKAALLKEEEEKLLPHKRKRRSKDKEGGNDNVSEEEDDETEKSDKKNKMEKEEKEKDRERDKEREKEKLKKFRKPLPPPMDFNQLLKIAEQKQHEPIVIKKDLPDLKRPEPERLMTKKEKMEYEKEKERRLNRDKRLAELNKAGSVLSRSADGSEKKKSTDKASSKIEPKENLSIEEKLKKDSKVWSSPSNLSSDKNSCIARKKVREREHEILRTRNDSISKLDNSNEPSYLNNESKNNKISSKSSSTNNPKVNDSSSKRQLFPSKTSEKSSLSSSILENTLRKPTHREENEKSKVPSSFKEGSKDKSINDSKTKSLSVNDNKNREFSSKELKSKESSLKDVRSREFSMKVNKSREFSPKDIKPRKFPPDDLRPRQFPPPDVKRKLSKPVKRRIESDDEYDSELDDFIDDGDEEDPNEVSKAISQIFGYDKSKYRYLDDEDDSAMESNFHQVQKEEFHSTRIGIMEDLEDIRREKEEERRKAIMKKKRLEQMKLKHR